MATHLVKDEHKLTSHSSDSEEEVEDHNWDDWKDEEDALEDQSSNPQLLCLFCDSPYDSCSSLFQHCASTHLFDFYAIKKAYSLDFYKCFKLINYVRSQVAVNKCWSCGTICTSKEDLQKHLHESANFDGNILWDDDKYLNPFLQDDSLLYSFDEDEEDEEDALPLDREELESYISQIEPIDMRDEGTSDISASELVIPCENGGNVTAKPLEGLIVDKGCTTAEASLPCRNRKNETNVKSSIKIASDQIKNINKNYFNSYSSFGIHREMISDKVRTDAYRQAILENPSLMRNAVVMDVGCGTGILSLFAAQAGASRVIAIEASEKMAAVATQIAKDNGLLRNEISSESSKKNCVIEVVQGMVEELEDADQIRPQSVDVLFSEWMGYCLLYESMLTSVLFARDKWLKPGGAILPDTATMFVAGFGRGASSLKFWENVYGFNMSCIGREIDEDAARFPIVDVIDSCNIVTTTEVLQSFDLVTMQPKQIDFTAEVVLEPNSKKPDEEVTWCHGLVLWFETGFTERFCREKPVILSTSPYHPSTHWSQTVLTFREPIAMVGPHKPVAAVCGGTDFLAARIQSRLSIVRASQHRTIDISMELTGIGPDGQKRTWPAQIFNLD
ncbi:protein arginine n-methyltransferase [Striga asiatica]|uniref:Protein arginine n-methyltransferase n=1 Tax=Striga asiatica TaxID=4170 RepID=A0A5A7QN94_STRAF|nr:protein arginine n-methyltransferase [Striga asiatica]